MNKSLRKVTDERSGLGYFITIAITISVILSVVALAIALQPEAKAQVVKPYLVVEDVYFVMEPNTEDVISGEVSIKMSAFITNQGQKDAVNVEVRAFAIDQETNIGVDDTRETLGIIAKKTTGETNLMLFVPEGKTYRIELLVFESGKITVRGSGTVKLLGSGGTSGEDFTVDGDADGYGPAKDEESEDAGGLGGLSSSKGGSSVAAVFALIIIVIVITIVLAAMASSSKKKPERVIPPPTVLPFPNTRSTAVNNDNDSSSEDDSSASTLNDFAYKSEV
ncbi:MAG: hypothetical protein JSV49_06680 [Thermoplasmata archaeon]|nr:MAG: hypothetical protein JSV49_06680 [Thermoplasmata archaeon]